jgi:hypothetical protein
MDAYPKEEIDTTALCTNLPCRELTHLHPETGADRNDRSCRGAHLTGQECQCAVGKRSRKCLTKYCMSVAQRLSHYVNKLLRYRVDNKC